MIKTSSKSVIKSRICSSGKEQGKGVEAEKTYDVVDTL